MTLNANKVGKLLRAAMAVAIGLQIGCAAEDSTEQTSFDSMVGTAVVPQSGLLNDSTGGVHAPRCESVYSDADGDGWGWENQRTCRATAVDAANTLPASADLPVGIVYYLWHCVTKTDGYSRRHQNMGFGDNEELNITRIQNGQQPSWGNAGVFHWWDQPDEGYYCLGNEPDVIVSHLEQLRDAGVDFLVLDITNHPNTASLDAETFILKSFAPLLEAASQVPNAPRIVPWVPFAADSDSTINERAGVCDNRGQASQCQYMENAQPMYRHVTNVLQNQYPQLTFEYEGKPLVLEAANDNKYPRAETDVVRQQLQTAWSTRRMWGLRPANDEWQFLTTCSNPEQFYKTRGWAAEGCNQPLNAGEQISVSAAYQYTYITEQFSVAPQSHSGYTGGMPKFYGRTLAQQFRVAFDHRDSQPLVILTGWNEWIAQRFDFEGRVAFVDLFDDNLNRDIEPGGASGDLYYHLMKDLITQYRNDQPFAFEDYFLTQNSVFDARYYHDTYTDLQAVFAADDYTGLLNHWLTVGLHEGRRPSVLFDANFYRNRYPALADAGVATNEALLNHFIDFGFSAGRQGSAEFHAPVYINRYAQVAEMFGQNGYYKAAKYYMSVGQFAPSNHSARP